MTVATAAQPRILRPYQVEAVEAVYHAWSQGIRRPAVVAATGLGKSSMIAQIAVDARARGLRVAMLAHRGELLGQMADSVLAVDPHGPRPGIVQAGLDESTEAIIAGSFQTLVNAERRHRIGRRDIILCDEGHHIVAETYTNVIRDLGAFDPDSGVLMAGFTATMSRTDGGLGGVWDEVVFERDIRWALENGFLVRPHGLTVVLPGLDLSKIRTVAGDYANGELAEAMAASVESTVDAYVRYATGRSTIVFAAGVDHADALAEALCFRGVRADAVLGSMDTAAREDVYRRFRDGTLEAMVTVQVLTEGADFPRCDAVVLARPTKSQTLYCFDDQTEILTRQGWVLGTDLDPAAEVAAFDTETSAVTWETPSASIVRDLYPDERMVAYSTPTLDMRVTENHRVVWKAANKATWRVSEAGDLLDRKTGFRVPVCGVEDTPGVPLTDAEVAFIGWVMTDGTVNRKTKAVQISQQDPENCAEIERVLTECGFKWRVSITTSDTNFGPRKNPLKVYRVSQGTPRKEDKHLRGWGDLGPYLPKEDGPAAYARLESMTVEQFRVFLDAFHRANGAKQAGQTWTRQGYHLFTPYRDLAEWTQSMCVRRGWRANFAVDTAGRDVPIYVIHCREMGTRTLGGSGQADRPHLEWSETAADEQVWCVTVSTGAVLARRNGKAFVSGNCQMVGRALRTYPGKTDALVLDLAGSTRDTSLVTVTDLSPEAKTRKVTPDGEEVEEDDLDEPAAGAPPRRFREGPLELETIDLLAASAANWLTTDGGVRFLDVQGHLVFLWPPHPPEAGPVSVGWTPSRGRRQVSWAAGDDGTPITGTLAQAVEGAELIAPTLGTVPYRDASWRSTAKPSEGQVKFAAGLGIADPEGKTRARLSDDISTALASRLLPVK